MNNNNLHKLFFIELLINSLNQANFLFVQMGKFVLKLMRFLAKQRIFFWKTTTNWLIKLHWIEQNSW